MKTLLPTILVCVAAVAMLAATLAVPGDDEAKPTAPALVAEQDRAERSAIRTEAAAEDADAVRFGWVDVFIDTGDQPLAAYQFKLASAPAQSGGVPKVRIVGLEGAGDLPFTDPPYYDPRAMRDDRVIVAAYSTASADALPAGRFRLARIHLQITGAGRPAIESELSVAVDHEGRDIPAELSIKQGSAR